MADLTFSLNRKAKPLMPCNFIIKAIGYTKVQLKHYSNSPFDDVPIVVARYYPFLTSVSPRLGTIVILKLQGVFVEFSSLQTVHL